MQVLMQLYSYCIAQSISSYHKHTWVALREEYTLGDYTQFLKDRFMLPLYGKNIDTWI